VSGYIASITSTGLNGPISFNEMLCSIFVEACEQAVQRLHVIDPSEMRGRMVINHARFNTLFIREQLRYHKCPFITRPNSHSYALARSTNIIGFPVDS
jgi:hypothetical protein